MTGNLESEDRNCIQIIYLKYFVIWAQLKYLFEDWKFQLDKNPFFGLKIEAFKAKI